MHRFLLPDKNRIAENDLIENPNVSEFFVDGAVVRIKNGLVHILGYRLFEAGGGQLTEHTVTWHMPEGAFDPGSVCACWRQRGGLEKAVKDRCH